MSSSPPLGAVDLADHDVDDAVQNVVLVLDVVVERHRLDAERLGELAHAERVDPAAIGQVDRGAQDAFPGQCSERRCGSALTELYVP